MTSGSGWPLWESSCSALCKHTREPRQDRWITVQNFSCQGILGQSWFWLFQLLSILLCAIKLVAIYILSPILPVVVFTSLIHLSSCCIHVTAPTANSKGRSSGRTPDKLKSDLKWEQFTLLVPRWILRATTWPVETTALCLLRNTTYNEQSLVALSHEI